MNAAGFPLLSLLTFLPLVGAGILLFIRGEEAVVASNARWTALWTSLIVFGLSLILWFSFDKSTADYQFVEQMAWMPEFGLGYHMGVDGISVLFVLLSTLLTPICILASWEAVQTRVREYMIAFLVLETMMIGMFASLDMLMFYIFFEGVLVPMFLIIGVWGGARRVYAAYKLFLYTLLGSLLMLLAILTLWYMAGTTSIPALANLQIPQNVQIWMFLAFFASFAVKVPMWPVHTWLPDAHVEAPTAGSVILAGVLLKMGGYGFLRFSLPLLPQATEWFAPLIFALSIIAVIYTSLVAMAQEDMKKLIAYSSVAHMGIVTLGIFVLNHQGLSGAIFQMLSHGIVSGALFLCVGVVYDRVHSREIARYGGVAKVMPAYAVLFMLFTMASVALPGTAGFPGEFMVLVGAWQVNPWVAFLAGFSMILGAAYMLWLYRRVLFGNLTKGEIKSLLDLSPREYLTFAPLVLLTIWMGIYPSSFTSFFDASVTALLARHEAALALPRLAGM
ncbi:NADH-quinone oxidoreductase subunit M [Roseomonas marmotae]|uniref:NADH-quinone oxidoreductase subunit M n=1 Tax=Roseomonas marmotae TaxID=2768161 RepID=A0ABS3KB02_9PROT|nr:NADH-quinone oxidoreductase subunit M [Roseomonas marmotae]MBO1073536.1 NADH-quinone oxidoreductase subunit M [Roseomonas marmotae]QTI80277.1 NADH-quinone oxidoreductase subunit M [Roseomonas marmotae]